VQSRVTSVYTYPASGSGSVRPHAATDVSNLGPYEYDANGNMTSRAVGGDTYDFEYDADNRVVGMLRNWNSAATFNYDGDGKRPKGSAAGITFTAVGGYYERTGATTIRKYYTFNARVVAMRQNGTLSWLLSGQLGSTSMAVSLTGTVQSQQRYWPWGTARNASGTLPTDYRYTWQQEMGVIGLYDYDARWYDADLKRFVQADALVPQPGNPQALNRYSCALNSPLRHTDSSGHYVDEGNFWLQPGCSYDPGLVYYLLWAAGGSVRLDTYFLSPSASKDIFGVAGPQRVSVGTVVAVNDPKNIARCFGVYGLNLPY
jgi:RHS repeat-associated protein